jgi:hypothetical protein
LVIPAIGANMSGESSEIDPIRSFGKVFCSAAGMSNYTIGQVARPNSFIWQPASQFLISFQRIYSVGIA